MTFPKLVSLALAIPLTIALPTLNFDRASISTSSSAIAQTLPDLSDPTVQLYLRADGLVSAGFTEEGITLYEQLLQQLRERGDRDEEARFLRGIASDFELQGDLQNALTYYQRAFAIYGGRIISPVDRTAQLFHASEVANTMGSIYLALGQPEQAIEAYQQALAIDRRSNLQWVELATLSNLGTSYQVAGQTEQALAVYQEAISIYREIDGSPYEAAQLFNQLGMIYQEQGEFESALAAYQQGLEAVAKQSEDFQAVHRLLTLENISNLYQAQGQTEQAENYAQQAATALAQVSIDSYGIESPFRGADLLQKIGTFYLTNRQLERANLYFDRALAIASQHPGGNPEVILNSILVEYTRRGQIEQAIPYQQRNLEILQDMDLLEGVASSLRRLASMYQTIGQLDSALAAYQQALSTYQESDRGYGGKTEEIAQTLVEIGAVYVAQSKPEQALMAYQQALSLYQTEQALPSLGLLRVFDALATFYTAQGQGDQAQHYSQQAQTLRSQFFR